ncbi:MAG: SDR family oxidoreductase [Gemmatimonadetes bacterium]|nr:SDR family oxidoreductase [Gemmatimonadota bacterium]
MVEGLDQASSERRSGRSGGGRSALITGATGGIGSAVARALALRGYRVGLLARREGPLRVLAEELGGFSLPCDVTDADAVVAAVARFEQETGGPLELVVSCAGAFSLQRVNELDPEELERQLSVNLLGSILLARAVLPGMRKAGRGILLQVGSVAGRKPLPGNAAYAASKYGLRGFHEVLRDELRGSGVRVTLLEPAATDTPLWDPLDPDADHALPNRSDMLRAEDVAEAVLFAAERPNGVQIPYLSIERVPGVAPSMRT